MKIDKVSSNIIRLALYLDTIKPGAASEIWLEDDLLQQLREDLPSKDTLATVFFETETLIDSITDGRRRQYLTEIFNNLSFQIAHNQGQLSLTDFYQQTFGFPITRISTDEITTIETTIQKYETQLGQSRFEIVKQHIIPPVNIDEQFQVMVDRVKSHLPRNVISFPDGGFRFESVTNKPWAAFNTHLKPFVSQLSLNRDIDIYEMNLLRIASHEAYGGHHTELSNKDLLLTQEGRGEHGLVITYSVQTFISEAIADAMYVLLGIQDTQNPVEMMSWYYERFQFALQNLATFMYQEDGKSIDQIDQMLRTYSITEKSRKSIASFSTDPVFSQYAAVYYSAFNFLNDLYERTPEKQKLIHTLFTKPCSVSLLTSEFAN